MLAHSLRAGVGLDPCDVCAHLRKAIRVQLWREKARCRAAPGATSTRLFGEEMDPDGAGCRAATKVALRETKARSVRHEHITASGSTRVPYPHTSVKQSVCSSGEKRPVPGLAGCVLGAGNACCRNRPALRFEARLSRPLVLRRSVVGVRCPPPLLPFRFPGVASANGCVLARAPDPFPKNNAPRPLPLQARF